MKRKKKTCEKLKEKKKKMEKGEVYNSTKQRQ